MGREMSLEFASRGANVVLSSNIEAEIGAVAAECESLAGRAIAVVADVTDESDLSDLVDAAVGEFAGVDGLVNNAGVIRASVVSDRGTLSDITMDDWNQIMDVNLGGTVRGMKAVIPVMSHARRGSIINLSSGTVRAPLPGLGPYTTSKFAIEGITKIAALELQEFGIRVNAIQPGGPVNTALMSPEMGQEVRSRLHQPSVIRKCAAWLLGDESSLLSGRSFVALEWNRERGLVECPCPSCTTRDLNPGASTWSSSAR